LRRGRIESHFGLTESEEVGGPSRIGSIDGPVQRESEVDAVWEKREEGGGKTE
jgi:hypothetical protein